MRAEREGAANVREDVREPRNHESQENDYSDGRDHGQEGGVEQRREDLRPELRAFLHVLRQTHEHDVERAARLAGRDHGNEEGIEVPRMLGEGVGETGAALYGAAHLPDRLRKAVMTRVLCGERERPVERDSRAEQRRGVPGPERHGGAATEPPPAPRRADGRRFVDRDRIEVLATQLLEHRLARGRMQHAFHHLPVRCSRPVAEPEAHNSASSAVTRRTSSSVVVPAHAFAQPAARSGAMPCACASARISASGARWTTRSRKSSLIGISS